MSNILTKSGTESWKWPRSTVQGSIKPEMTRKKETYVEKDTNPSLVIRWFWD